MPPYSYREDRRVPPFPDDPPIIIFDGYCTLCSGWAAFVLRHGRAGKFRLLSAQSPLGQALYVHYGLDPQDYETNILIADGVAWFKSEGSIRMAEGLGFPWSLAAVFRVLPRAWRDRLYETVAQPAALVRQARPAIAPSRVSPTDSSREQAGPDVRRWRVFGLPLPLRLAPRGDSYEHAEDGRFHFRVEIGHPLTGFIVRYRGWLVAR